MVEIHPDVTEISPFTRSSDWWMQLTRPTTLRQSWHRLHPISHLILTFWDLYHFQPLTLSFLKPHLLWFFMYPFSSCTARS